MNTSTKISMLIGCLAIAGAAVAEKYADHDANPVPSIGQNAADVRAFGDSGHPRVLILGNSILRHGPKPSIGWTNDWGMAASALDKDYVHLLAAKIKAKYPKASFAMSNVAGTFERKFREGVDLKRNFAWMRGWRPDLVIMFFGANCPKDYDAKPDGSFGRSLEALRNYLTDYNKGYYIHVGGFYDRPVLEREKQALAKKWNDLYVPMDDIRARDDVRGRFNHPSDNGMRLIADRIAEYVFKLSLDTRYAKPNPKAAANRLPFIDPPAIGELRLRSTFVSIGMTYGCETAVDGMKLEYRAVGTDGWKTALKPEYFDETKSYRGSIFYLNEDTDYEVRLAAGERVFTSDRVRTWKSDVPVAKTVEIDPATFKAPYVIFEKGTADGWIRYVVKGGRLEVPVSERAFLLKGAEYVLLDDMTIHGCKGAQSVITLEDTKNVRIRHCDLSGWGRVGTPDYIAQGGKYTIAAGKKKRVINLDGAIYVSKGCENSVIERCYVHDPRSRTNSWRYSHPAGAQAVVVAHAGPGTVIRYNDFVGSDLYRWNDAVEGPGNFIENGGLHRDADVYGNFMIYSNDDNIELDGGQQNVRCFQNRFEGAYNGVSIQGCMVGPSYVFDNIFPKGRDEFGLGGNPIKTAGINLYGRYTCANVFNNEFWDADAQFGIDDQRMRLVLRDNRSASNVYSGKVGPFGTFENNRTDVVFDHTGPIVMPYRPVPYVLDRGMIEGNETVKITAKCGGTGYEQPFEVVMTEVCDWVKVTPAKGVMRSGEDVVFTVSFDAEKMRDRHDYRGAFLVRTADGYSRPVSTYSRGVYENPRRPEIGADKTAVYIEARNADFAKGKKYVEFAFDLPKQGKYAVLLFVKGCGKLQFTGGFDDDALAKCMIRGDGYWGWQAFSPNSARMPKDVRMGVYEFAAGRHVIRAKCRSGLDKVEIDGIVVTDDIGAFEPR